VDNFHGRTMTAVSLSSDKDNRRGFGPMLPGFKVIPFGDIEALKAAITENTAGFLFEPIQGEAGVNIPSEEFLHEAYVVCKENNVVNIVSEIKAGLVRS